MDLPLLRPATQADTDAIADIYADAVRHGTASYELEPPTHAEMAARFEVLAAGGYPYLVAEDDGRVLGYAYAGPFRPRPAYRFTVEDSIYLHPEVKGRGLGRLLLKRLVGEAEALGFRQMIAVIGDGKANIASVRLHAALGFTHAGTIEGTGFKHGRWLDTVFMRKALNEGVTAAPDPASLPERRFRNER
ncbi:MAG: GNAT family N-acetyltransferase [Rhizobiaceae bacterium]|nr:GNAT family N-acetyltransferase [Rhizobiaceae bacterium]MCV0407339.1 GNAT family N-acetyltransferase [Rhizobiaceae bacterium]